MLSTNCAREKTGLPLIIIKARLVTRGQLLYANIEYSI